MRDTRAASANSTPPLLRISRRIAAYKSTVFTTELLGSIDGTGLYVHDVPWRWSSRLGGSNGRQKMSS